jgi:hypothetical protein
MRTISETLVKFLHLVDREKPSMGYLYEDMDRTCYTPTCWVLKVLEDVTPWFESVLFEWQIQSLGM